MLRRFQQRIRSVDCTDRPGHLRLPDGERHRGNPDHLWDDDARFNDLMKQIAGRTLVDKTRCFICYQWARQVSELPGDVAEVGVYRGGTARLLSKVFESKHKTVHLFDTFAGMPASDPMRDRHQERDFGDASLESVKAYLQDCRNIRIHPGLFPATSTPIEDKTFCLVHIDADIYASVMDGCRFFYPRMQKGGVMIFDDYGFLTCPGAKLAVDEFFTDKPEHPCYLPTGQCIVDAVKQTEFPKFKKASQTFNYPFILR
jgi:O-methyltransferase